MCGRFTLRVPQHILVEEFSIRAGTDLSYEPRYNVAPTQEVAVVRLHDGHRDLVALRWGLIPSWAKDVKIGSRMINARAETIASKPSYRTAFKRRRCLVLADGYYEWKKPASGGGNKRPYYFRRKDERPFAFAGLWERCSQGETPVESCTIITTDANELTRPIHDRMPVILSSDDYDRWMDPTFADKDALQAKLVPYQGDDFVAVPVSTLVNSPRNDVPECTEPISVEG